MQAQKKKGKASLRKYYTRVLRYKKDIFTVPEIRKIIGYKPQSYCRWMEKGALKAFRFEGKILIRKSDLFAFLTSPAFTNIVQKSPQHLAYAQNIRDMMEK